MLTATSIISAALAMAPPSTIETSTTDNAAEVLVYDDDGEVSAVLVLQAEPSGRIRLDADFADGSI